MVSLIIKLIKFISFLATLTKVASFLKKIKGLRNILKFSLLSGFSTKFKIGIFTIILIYLVGLHVGLWFAYKKYKACIISNGKIEERYEVIKSELSKCLKSIEDKDKFIQDLKNK